MQTGTKVKVLPKVAITMDMMPIKQLKAIAVLFPIVQ